MFKSTIIGIIILICDALLFLFKMLTILMEREKEFHLYTICQVVETFGGGDGKSWIAQFPPFMQGTVETISTTSLFIVLGVLGGIFVVIGMFKK